MIEYEIAKQKVLQYLQNKHANDPIELKESQYVYDEETITFEFGWLIKFGQLPDQLVETNNPPSYSGGLGSVVLIDKYSGKCIEFLDRPWRQRMVDLYIKYRNEGTEPLNKELGLVIDEFEIFG